MEKSLTEIEDEKVYNTPEKWYVRKKWLDNALKRKSKINKPLKFFTLTCCGVYEVRYFRDNGVISKIGDIYDENLAFCEKIGHRFALIQGKLPGARYRQVEFEDLITSHDVVISQKVSEWFPFDVINLDFNESMFTQGTKFFNAIKKLLTIQKMRECSFTLFLTFNLIAGSHHSSNKQILNEILDNNIKLDDLVQIREKLIEINFEDYTKYISCLIPKFIIEEAFKNNFDVELLESMVYIGENNTTPMISFIFEINFHRNPRITLTSNLTISRISQIVNDPININSLLTSNENLRDEMMKLVEKYKE